MVLALFFPEGQIHFPKGPSVSSVPWKCSHGPCLNDRVSTASHLWALVHAILALKPVTLRNLLATHVVRDSWEGPY